MDAISCSLVPIEPVIEFATQRYEMKENGSISITVVRHGNLNIESTFKCIQHSEEAIVEQDFHSNLQETVVTMGINESVAFCTLRGIDDDVWEGPENLRYSLRPSDGYSLLGQKSEANIRLVDPEDSEFVRDHHGTCLILCSIRYHRYSTIIQQFYNV